MLPARFEWVELVIGLPVMIGAYALLVWKLAFRDADRTLFRKHKLGDTADTP
jgi:hypothetical protein